MHSQEVIKIKTGGDMDIISLIIFLAVGALAGWLAGNIMRGRGLASQAMLLSVLWVLYWVALCSVCSA